MMLNAKQGLSQTGLHTSKLTPVCSGIRHLHHNRSPAFLWSETPSSGSICYHKVTRHVSRCAAAVQDDALTKKNVVITTKDEDTIAAVVTGSLSQGTVAIIRISGSDALSVASKFFRPGGKAKSDWKPESHTVTWGTVVDKSGQVLDEAHRQQLQDGLLDNDIVQMKQSPFIDQVLMLAMLSPRSYTCEDVVEIHTHGGGVCASRVLQACIEAGARRARPGEFTLRAFLNGRLDLSQAEAVSSLLTARTAAAADSALAGLQGGLAQVVRDLRARTIGLLAEIEARIDFDEDLPAMDATRLRDQVESVQTDIEAALRTARSGTLLRQGLTVAIVGRPNVGKSSLLNAWSRTDRAIVTDIAGTTRDVLEAGLVVGGVPVTLLDTAGIREAQDVVEKIGVQRSREAATAADIVVMVLDAQSGWADGDGQIFKALWGAGPGTASCVVRGQSLLVVNKTDLVPTSSVDEQDTHTDFAPLQPLMAARSAANTDSGSGSGSSNGSSVRAPSRSPSPAAPISLPLLAQEVFQRVVYTSAKDGAGIQQLDEALLELAGAPSLAQGGASWAVNERQAEALVRAHEALGKVCESMIGGLPIDFWTIDLRSALIALGEISGDEVTEEVLDKVFSTFCIGK